MPDNPERRRQQGRDPNKQTIPEWAERERERDLAWIVENMHVFEPAIRAQLTTQGPGAIVVDTTVQPDPSAGHPMFYASSDFVDQTADEDTKRMVGAYDPANEFVLVMLKPHDRVSTYRIQFPSEQEPPGAPLPPAGGRNR